MAITLRTTKSRALTHEELDGNFTDLNGRTTTIEGAYVTSVNGLSATSNAITITTDSINEGSTNLYFTNARADARITAADLNDLGNVDYTGTPTTNHVLTWDGDSWVSAAPPGLGGGEANSGTQLGSGVDVFKDKVGTDLRFRSIIATAPLVATENTDDITLTFTPSADLDVNTQKIINVVDPTAAQHAATKNYTDTTFLGLAGGTMTGAINMGSSNITNMADPTTAQHAATKNYVDTTSLLLAGGTMTGAIAMGTNKITGLGTPTNTADAATKGYVDGEISGFSTSLTIAADTGSNDTVTVGTDILTFAGTANEVNTIVTNNQIQIGLPNNVTITNNLTVGGDLTVTGTTLTTGANNLSIADQYIYLNTGDAIGASGTNFTGSGLDDGTLGGYFEGTTSTTYYVRIDGTGTPDTFEWSKDNFSTTEATGVAITGSAQTLDNNITIQFDATTGHTSGDVWSGTAAPIAQDAGFWANENNGTGKYGYTHVGIFYDQSDRTWKAVSAYDPEPEGNINIGAAGFEYAKFEAAEFITGSLVISGTELKTTVSNQSLELAANGTGTIQLQSDALLTAQQELRFGDSDSSNYVAFKSPATVSSDVTWTLPDADASVSGYALVSDSAGTLSWAAAGATVTNDGTTNTNFNLYFASTTSGALTAVKYDTALNYNPSTETLSSTLFSGTATTAQYADLAENYLADHDYEPGTVVQIGGTAEITQADADSIILAGVISTAPAYLMNSALEGGLPVALQGRVPVKIKGLVNKGEIVYASDNGVAEVDSTGNMVGIALEDKTTADIGLVECLLKC